MTDPLFVAVQQLGHGALITHLANDHIESISTDNTGRRVVITTGDHEYLLQQSVGQLLELIRGVVLQARDAAEIRALRAEDPRGRTLPARQE